ncbi:MAG: IPT/TIG domain-containing protein [bacterium]
MRLFSKWSALLGLVLVLAGCPKDSNGTLPTVTGVSPTLLCGGGGEIVISGTGFSDESVVSIAVGEDATPIATSLVDGETLVATVPGNTPAGTYDVAVTNPAGSATLEGSLTITVDANPVVYFVDPYTLYNGIALQVTIHGPAEASTVTDVTISPEGQPDQATSLEHTSDASGLLQAVVPAGLAPGWYDVRVIDENGCGGALERAIQIVGELAVAIESVELPFGWTDARTGVNIYSPEAPGAGLENFQATPRFYLSPVDASADTVASELKHTAYVSPTRVTSMVPAALPVGVYDLIAVNPSGNIGLLEGAFEVTALPPPVIEALEPPSVINQDTQEITVVGRNFRSPTFTAECRQPDATVVALAGTILSSTAASIQVELDFVTQTVTDGSVCLVRVTNDDDTYAIFSALGVTNPSLNLESFSPATSLITARRAPCAVAGEAAPGARFVYALGGDAGNSQDTDATPLYDTVELAAVDPYGDLGPWAELSYRLPTPRSFHGCVSIGRYVYVVGGAGPAGATDTVWRAQILDPERAPEIEGVSLTVDPTQTAGFQPGRYVYRVSALMPASNPINPDGETLAGNPTLVQTPHVAERVSVTLSWTPVEGAAAYRIYRTAGPGEPAGAERLLAEVSSASLTHTDDGTVTPSDAAPLPFGALGRFAVLPSLGVPREGAAIAVATDPATADIRYIYVLGGRDDTGAGLNSIEWLDITLQTDGTHAVGSTWTTGTANIGPARWQLGAWVADAHSAPDLLSATETWIYAGGGIAANLQSLQPDVVALQVEAGGALGEAAGGYYAVDDMQPFKAGYTAAMFNHQLFAFGGTQGTPSTECSSIEMCGIATGACTPGIPDPPDLANWNSLGIDLTVDRYLSAGATVSPFVFILGGVDDSNPNQPLSAVGKTLW